MERANWAELTMVVEIPSLELLPDYLVNYFFRVLRIVLSVGGGDATSWSGDSNIHVGERSEVAPETSGSEIGLPS